MEFLILGSTFVLLVSLVISIYFLYNQTHQQKHGESLPPGNMGWPWLGESLEFLAAGRKGKPESFIFDRLSKHSHDQGSSVQLNNGGQFKTRLFGYDVVVMAGTMANKLLFSNENKLVTMWWPPCVEKAFPSSDHLSINEEYSKKLKQFLPEFLTKTECLKRYVPLIDDCTRCHMETGAWGPSERIEAYNVTRDYTFLVACKVFLSIDAQEDPTNVATLFTLFKELLIGVMSLPIDIPGTKYYRAMKASEKIRQIIEGLIKKRRLELAEGKQSLTKDMLTHMLETPVEIISDKDREDGKEPKYLNDFDVASKMLGLVFAGHDTSSTIITFIFKFLAENPQVYEAVYQEQIEVARSKAPHTLLNWDDLKKMKYSWCVACEVMRLTPPVQGGYREVITEFVHNGFLIPKGWKVHWSTHSTHLNPECFPNPKKFDPTRFEGTGPPPFAFVPFGGGPRMCPGKEYARLKILTFMHNIVIRFKWELLVPHEKIIVSPVPYPANNLPLRMIPHSGIMQ